MRFAVGILLVTAAAGTLFAQHTYTPADVEDGGRLYRSTCVTCHGQDGNLVPGVALMRNQFRRASTDDGLIAIIQKGIAGTPMPPNNFTEFQAGTIVAYLRSSAATGGGTAAAGDAARGKVIFEGKGACTGCHRIRGNGALVAPDLTDIGALRRPAQIEKSILDPDAEILAQNRTYRVVTRDGTTITGRILNVDTFTVQLLDPQGLRSFQKSNLRSYGFVDQSPMPSFQGKLTAQEVADVVSYLAAQKGIDTR